MPNDFNNHPKYSSQPMVVTSDGASAAPWRFVLAALTSRFFAIALAVVDALISYKGLRDWNVDIFPAAMVSVMIGLLQGCIGVALTSGVPVGEEFNARFFSDSGAIGVIRRSLGVFVIGAIVLLYLVDVITNFVSLHGFQFDTSANGIVRAVVLLACGCFFTFGDELFHIISDIMDGHASRNTVAFRSRTYDAQLRDRYQRHYVKHAEAEADRLGAEHGQQWKPR